MAKAVKRSRQAAAGNRAYDSTRRRARAAESRRRILSSALELFLAQGYGRTSLSQVASAAQVSVETIYATYRTKSALLRAVWFFAARGDESEVALLDRAEVRAILAEPDLRIRHARYAEFLAAFHRRMSPLLDMVTGAAASEAGAAEMVATWAARRLEVATAHADAAAATGRLAVPARQYRDVVYALLQGDLWRALVAERGWSDAEYAAWLAAVLDAQLAS